MAVAVSITTLMGLGTGADVRLAVCGDPSDGRDCCQKLLLLGTSAAIAFSGVAAQAGKLLRPLFTAEPVPARASWQGPGLRR